MKKILFLAIALAVGVLSVEAQVFNASAPERLGTVKGTMAIISADGKFVITNTEAGLERVDVATGESKFVAESPNSYNFVISPDGKTLAFNRAYVGEDQLRRVSLEIIKIADGAKEVIVKPSRNLSAGVSMAGNKLVAVDNGKVKTKKLGKVKKVDTPLITTSYGHLDITENGKTRHLDPLGKGSYLWPSISPDGKRILFRLVGEGVFTCNLDGSDVREVAKKIAMPVWAGNDAILGLITTDDSHYILSSNVTAVSLKDGAKQQLTPDDMLPMGVSCSADGSIAVFNNGNGELYTIRLKE